MTICATCEHFTLKTDPERAAVGRGHCLGFLPDAMNFVDWNDPACKLYRKAKQMAARDMWIAERAALEAKAVAVCIEFGRAA
jgi:hypothetical protein